MANQLPFNAPCVRSASTAYTLHGGSNRHRGPNSGLTIRRYPTMGPAKALAGRERH